MRHWVGQNRTISGINRVLPTLFYLLDGMRHWVDDGDLRTCLLVSSSPTTGNSFPLMPPSPTCGAWGRGRQGRARACSSLPASV